MDAARTVKAARRRLIKRGDRVLASRMEARIAAYTLFLDGGRTLHAVPDPTDAYLPPSEYDDPMAAPSRPMDISVVSIAEAFGMGGGDNPTDDASFYIQRGMLPRLKELARKHGVSFRVQDDEDTARSLAWMLAARNVDPRATADAVSREQDRLMGSARQMALRWKWVTVTYPHTERYQTIAMAKRVGETDNAATIYTFPDGEHYWTPERVAGFSFARCDRCNTNRMRNTVYVVEDATRAGEPLQLGGSCAKALDLGVKFKAALKGIVKLLEEGRREGFIFGERWARGVLDKDHVIALTDGWIRESGYVSGKKAYESRGDVESTKTHVGFMLGEHPHPPYGHFANRYSKAYRSEEGRARIEGLNEWMRKVVDKAEARADGGNADKVKFAANLRASFDFPHHRTLGYFVYLVSAAAQDAARAGSPESAGLWPSEEGMGVNTVGEMRAVAERGGWGTVGELGEFLGVDSEKMAKVEARGDDVMMPKYVLSKLARHPQGLWYVSDTRYNAEWDFYSMSLIRLDDGAKLNPSGSEKMDEGTVVRFGTVYVKSDDPNNSYVRRYGPSINRITWEPVDVKMRGGLVSGPELGET